MVAGDEKSIPDLKITFMRHGQLCSILDSYSIPGIDFYLHNPSKKYRLCIGIETSSTGIHSILKIKMIFSG
jgi:hypothetical protein